MPSPPTRADFPPWCLSHPKIHSTNGAYQCFWMLRGRGQVRLEDSFILPPRPLPPLSYCCSRVSSEPPSLPFSSIAPRPELCGWARRSRVVMIYSPLNTSGESRMVRSTHFSSPLRSTAAKPFLFLPPSSRLQTGSRPSITICSKPTTQAFRYKVQKRATTHREPT